MLEKIPSSERLLLQPEVEERTEEKTTTAFRGGTNAEKSCAESTESPFLVPYLCRWKLLSALLPLKDGNIPVKQLQTHHCHFPMENVDIIKRALSVREAFCQTFPDLALYLTFCLIFSICKMDVLILSHLYKMLVFVD